MRDFEPRLHVGDILFKPATQKVKWSASYTPDTWPKGYYKITSFRPNNGPAYGRTKAWQWSYGYVKCKKDGTEYGIHSSNGITVEKMHEMLDEAVFAVVHRASPENEQAEAE